MKKTVFTKIITTRTNKTKAGVEAAVAKVSRKRLVNKARSYIVHQLGPIIKQLSYE